jgi:hypothetical protein
VHPTIQLALQIATLVSVMIGFCGLIITVNNYRKQMNVQILMKYCERYDRILEQFPEEALSARFDAKVLPAPNPKLTLCGLRYLNLCAEEFYLTTNGHLSKALWCIWEADLKRVLSSPLLRREWPALKGEFLSHPAFLQYVERAQAASHPSAP